MSIYHTTLNSGIFVWFFFSHVRTNQIGTYLHRNPRIIDEKSLYKRVVGRMIGTLLARGPDKKPAKYPNRPKDLRVYRPPTSSYGVPAPTTSYSPPSSSYGPPKRPQYGAVRRPPRLVGSRPSFGSKLRPPRKSSPSLPKLKLPIVQDSTGHPYPPQPEGATFSFQEKPRPKRLQSIQKEFQGKKDNSK